MEDKNKNITEAINKGFVRGLVGKEEDTSMARRLRSSEPLSDEVAKLRKLYIIGLISCIIILPIGIFVLMIVYCINSAVTDHKRDRLRAKKFKFREDINFDTLFETMQPVLIKKYGMQIEK